MTRLFTRPPRLWLFCLGLIAGVAALAPQPAAAAYPCPNGPGPGEVQVGIADGGHGIANMPMCNRVGGQGGDAGGVSGGGMAGGGVYYVYGAIAWHPDVGDVWMVGNQYAPHRAEREAMAACNQAMGGGCSSIGEWHNSSMAILRDRSGLLWNAWTGNGGADRKRLLDDCSGRQIIPCELVATFSSGKRRHEPNLAAARKLYAAGAWVEGTEGFDSRLYIASGQRDVATADRLALDACTRATRQRCALLARVGNGFIQTYRLGAEDQSATAETTAARAAQAARANCRKHGQTCTLQKSYDSRTPGEFVHNFLSTSAE